MSDLKVSTQSLAVSPRHLPEIFAAGAPRFPAGTPAGGGLSEILQLLLRHKQRLLLGAVAGLVLAVLAGSLMPPRYQARVALEIQNPNADFLNARAVTSVAESSAADNGSLTDVATEIKIIESDQLLDRVIAQLLADNQAGPLEQRAAHQSLPARLLRRPPPTGERLLYNMRQVARAGLSAKQIGPTRAVEILFTSSDPKFSALFANALAQQYIDMSEESRWSKSRRTEKSLARELEDVRARLKQSQDALQKYATSSGLLFVNGRQPGGDLGEISESKLSQLQSALSLAHDDRVAAQSHYEVARTADPADVADVLNDQRLRELQEKITDLKRQQAELGTTYTDENDKVQRIVAQLEPLEAAFDRQRNSILHRIEQDFRVAERRERLLQANYGDQVHVVVGKEGDTVQYSILKEEVDSNQRLYESVLEQVKRAGIASAVRSNNIEIYDPAKPPVVPASLSPVLLGAAGLFAGLLAVAAFTVLTESSERRLQEAGEVQGHLRIRELGAIPTSQPIKLLGSARGKNSDTELITWKKPQSIVDEAYRALFTSILYSDENGRAPHVLVFTSANAGEGKTTTVCNLGILMAELKQRVLLIDADLRRPRLHQVFGLSGEHGLRDVLGDANRRDAESLIQPTFVPNLFLLPSGVSLPSPTTLFHSDRLAPMLRQLRGVFDIILIDTSPSLLTADARILGRNADAVVLLTRAGITTCGEVEATAKIFADDGTRVLGTILNDVKVSRSSYRYYSRTA